jgi:hypothetical protein
MVNTYGLRAGWANGVWLNLIGKTVSFKIGADVIGTHNVEVNGIASSFTVKSELPAVKEPSSITCIVSERTIAVGDIITVSGAISPPRSGVTVNLTYSRPDGLTIINELITDVKGEFTDTYAPDMDGVWRVKASWGGNGEYEGATSPVVTFNVVKKPSSIACSVSPLKAKPGETITVSGSISPPRGGVTVTITYTKPDGSTITRTVTTNPEGGFTDTYMVKAEWAGDRKYEGAESETVTFTIAECIIATTAYGSELAPEVQALRGFRDKIVLSTFAGSQFMQLFYAWYYSFSPDLAVFIANHPPVKEAMKIILYPLIGILHLSTMAYAACSFNSEIGVVIAGLVASSLIGVAYFSPTTLAVLLVVKKFGRRLPKLKQLKLVAIPIPVGLILLCVGEFLALPTVVMAATGIIVIFTTALTTTTMAQKIAKRL